MGLSVAPGLPGCPGFVCESGDVGLSRRNLWFPCAPVEMLLTAVLDNQGCAWQPSARNESPECEPRTIVSHLSSVRLPYQALHLFRVFPSRFGT